MGPDAQFSTYVTLKLQNVKSTTVTVKGANPNWEQDFLFETNRMDTGLLVELWNKGMLWDKLLGCHWMPLMGIQFATEVGEGQWISLDAELVMNEGEVCGTHTPTGHILLIEAHFEPPYEYTIEDVAEFNRKRDMLNTFLDQEMNSWQEQEQDPTRSMHQYSLYSGLSEDSDYTSDVSYPIQQHPNATSHHANSSASQFGGISYLTQKTNKYNFEFKEMPEMMMKKASSVDHQLSGVDQTGYFDQNYPQPSRSIVGGRRLPQPKIQRQLSEDNEPLSYNSRPSNRPRKLPDISNKRSRSPFFNQTTTDTESGRLSQNNYFENESIASTNTVFTPTPVKSPQVTSARPRRQQPAIPRKRSLERQGGFEQLDESLQQKMQNQQQYDQTKIQPSQQNQHAFGETAQSKQYDGTKLHDQYNENENVQRQDSYESYTTSIGTEPEMYDEWNNRNHVATESHYQGIEIQRDNNSGWSYNNEKSWVPNDDSSRNQVQMQQTQQTNSLPSFPSQAPQPTVTSTASSGLTANVVNVMTNKMVGFLGGVANAVSSVSVNKPENVTNNFQTNTAIGNKVEESYGNSIMERTVNQFDKKEQWKNATMSESLIWQTVSEDDHFVDAYQGTMYNSENQQQKEVSPPYFTPAGSIDQDSGAVSHENYDRQNMLNEAIPNENLHGKDMQYQMSFNTENVSGLYPQPPPPSALKSETRTSEPKTVTFSDQIQETYNAEMNHTMQVPESDFNASAVEMLPVPAITATAADANSDHFGNQIEANETKSALSEFVPNDTAGMSKARIRWISAFNKIVAQINEKHALEDQSSYHLHKHIIWTLPLNLECFSKLKLDFSGSCFPNNPY
ncbi:protein unc-13 A-like protein [Dinothrombium tinctorium]|uniref:Protein unc-13 A-like protein n=1 Tax=Dinothrombium tinctorium TaxID=1965070 RepID=A0A3S3PU68_9ACAR|nr:protein unc-13 A-like protein [Dinothrombium tinctorium]